ncbi:MAG: hypothetical protein HY078_11770 [Elusimicrobia bacterium]|nr:hypothetical protein [Elusimicrobiota bacterium]
MGRAAGGTNPGYQAFSLLYAGFVGLPIVAGVDKFFNMLVDWSMYASPAYLSLFGGRLALMMRMVGIVEIAAGILVAFNPRIGARVVAVWLAGIIVNMLLLPGFFDVALRDFGLMVGAMALARLSDQYS